MKKIVLTTALISTLAFSTAQAGSGVPQDDLNQIFSAGTGEVTFQVGLSLSTPNNQVTGLSKQEMKATEGEWLIPVAFGILGAMAGGSAYLASHPHNATWGGGLHSAFWGGVAGASGGIGGAGWGLFGAGSAWGSSYSGWW